ncbi:hypothetical protein N0V90_000264 [Kalmusia sp. IMI 367209]|nr:hypothetical protein N0V90_000264 [Kalmusia sp. IMI 367209]
MPPTTSTFTPSPFQEPFIHTLDVASKRNFQDDPNYYAKYPRSLISASTVKSFTTGTGDAIYRSLAPLLETTNHELILVTCFWARSSSLKTLNAVLRNLSEKAIKRGTEKIRVRLCFSSSSLFQKLFHKQSVLGQMYQSNVWAKKLGLPDPQELGGLDIEIKSVFILPFSVMHPKFIIVDRQTVVLPSCNISWEEWFEGYISFSGPIVDQFMKFYELYWLRQDKGDLLTTDGEENDKPWHAEEAKTDDQGHGHVAAHFSTAAKPSPISNIQTVFLPSPHRRNPRFRPFASPESIIAPPTPLNAFVLTLLAKAEKSIRIQTPNLTSPPVLTSLLKSLERGVSVTILTSAKLMILEQLVTAGTTTSRCISKLIRRYKSLTKPTRRPATDEEAAIPIAKPGRLQVSFFEPIGGLKARGREEHEPQQSHLKMMIVDGEVLVLGSGNLDRASWFTSQELGVAFLSLNLVHEVESVVDRAIEGRSRLVYDSGEDA